MERVKRPVVARALIGHHATMAVVNRIAVLLGVLAFAVYLANGRVTLSETDSISSRTLPFAILGSGSLYLDPVREVAIDRYDPDRRWWAQPTKTGKIASLFPIWTPIIVAPLYVPAVGYLWIKGWDAERVYALSMIMERVAASATSAAAVLFLFLAMMRRGTATRDAAVLSAAFAFATGTWSISAQELWLHGVAELLCAIALWLLAGPAARGAVLAAGAVIALIACNRTPDAALAAGLGLAALWWSGRRWWMLAVAAVVPGALTLGYNLHLFGHILGAWGSTGVASQNNYPMLPGIAGLLFSPTRGLFVFTPFLILFPLGVWAALKRRDNPVLTLSLLAGLVAHVLIYSVTDWRAGWSYGPRYMIDALPVMVFLLAPAMQDMRLAMRSVLAVLIAFSVWVQFVGAYQYNGRSGPLIFVDDKNHVPNFRLAWHLAKSPFIVESKNEIQPPLMLGLFGRL